MTYYVFSQNNSGGVWDGPVYIAVEAESEKEAWQEALNRGAYEDPEFRMDCRCCGPRWSDNAVEELPSEEACQEYLARALSYCHIHPNGTALMVDAQGQETRVGRLQGGVNRV